MHLRITASSSPFRREADRHRENSELQTSTESSDPNRGGDRKNLEYSAGETSPSSAIRIEYGQKHREFQTTRMREAAAACMQSIASKTEQALGPPLSLHLLAVATPSHHGVARGVQPLGTMSQIMSATSRFSRHVCSGAPNGDEAPRCCEQVTSCQISQMQSMGTQFTNPPAVPTEPAASWTLMCRHDSQQSSVCRSEYAKAPCAAGQHNYPASPAALNFIAKKPKAYC